MPEMKTLTIGGTTYEVVDGTARNIMQNSGVFANTLAKYTPTTMGALEVGQSVFINVDDAPTEFLVAQQGLPTTTYSVDWSYDASCNGTWLIAKDIYTTSEWGSNADYETSTVHNYLNGDFFGLFDADVQTLIKEVKIPYRKGVSGTTVSGGANGLSTKVFLPSVCELNVYGGSNKACDGQPLELFKSSNATAARIATFNDSPLDWYTRSVNTYNASNGAWTVNTTGSCSQGTNPFGHVDGIRPMIILPSDAAAYLGGKTAYVKQVYETTLCDAQGNPYNIPGLGGGAGVQIATGSYVGTDKYGVSNPNTLTFDFVPRIVIVTQNGNNSLAPSGVGTWDGGFMWTYGAIRVKCGGNSNYELVTALNGTTFTWYSANNAYTQQNSTYTYNYIAIG